jgi:hypothetical protein
LLNIFGTNLKITTTNNSTMSTTQFCCYDKCMIAPYLGWRRWVRGIG